MGSQLAVGWSQIRAFGGLFSSDLGLPLAVEMSGQGKVGCMVPTLGPKSEESK